MSSGTAEIRLLGKVYPDYPETNNACFGELKDQGTFTLVSSLLKEQAKAGLDSLWRAVFVPKTRGRDSEDYNAGVGRDTRMDLFVSSVFALVFCVVVYMAVRFIARGSIGTALSSMAQSLPVTWESGSEPEAVEEVEEPDAGSEDSSTDEDYASDDAGVNTWDSTASRKRSNKWYQ
jgi:hypothetical protein